ncbi:FIST C-terminal domain-containing protein [bacterium]|nr:FIST C-terminal domain-containing protein [bacterium]
MGRAVEALRSQLADLPLKAVLLFASVDYDLDELAGALQGAFSVPVFGCTTAGHIGPLGYQLRGLQATGLYGDSLAVRVEVIRPLEQCQAVVSALGNRIEPLPTGSGMRRFGLLLVDGLSRMEERLAAALHHCFPDMPLIGGSAGDGLAFRETFVLADGRFLSNAAVLALFDTDAPFAAFKFQHFVPTDTILVVTAADSESRTVLEINGRPAALAYAEILGLSIEELSPDVYSRSPVMLKLGDDHYVRSIQRCNDDLSLTFYCAIAEGIVLRLGTAVSPLAAAKRAFAEVQQRVAKPSLIIGCDCILRRLEFENSGLSAAVGELLATHSVVGFSTYGEQFNALHMNQTFTGLAVGECR